jgi:MFS transporter, ACS family, hexuronate transporter
VSERDGPIGKYRWWICALLFFATTINYVDRQVIALLKDDVGGVLGWTKDNKEVLYSYLVVAFQAAYAAGYLLGGRFSDVVGLRWGYTTSVALWSLFAVATGFVRTSIGFYVARAGLGLAEGGNFPSAIKAVSEWFPAKERALATGLFNAGSNLGPILTPLIVPPLAVKYGWPAAFYVTGAIGSLWIIAWLAMYRKPEDHPKVGAAELDYIKSDPIDPVEHVSWLGLLRYRAVWAYVIGAMLTNPIWWFYLFWAPDFFSKQFGLNLKTIGLPLVAIYLLADIGSIGGGWLSSALIKRGWSVTKGRKTALLTCALCVVPVYFASQVANQLGAIGLLGLALAAHQGWSANLYTVASDTMPRKYVSSVVGMGGMMGGIVSIFFSLFVGEMLKKYQNYELVLFLCPCAYILAFLLMHFLLPSFEEAKESFASKAL